ncbi:MAG: M28 family peptidase [Bacteroidetes bacterium]|nr:M28 family peptidase [Bacteroidota bacterium]
MIKKTILLLFSPILLFAQQKDTIAIRYSKNITVADMSKNLHVLASDEYEGRETGKKGQKMAAEYISTQFKNAGILPYINNSYFQEFPLNLIIPQPAEISIGGKRFEGNKDYYNFPGQSEQTINEKNLLFLGYGIEEKNYNDYKGVDVKNKIVMILAGEPFSKDSVSIITGKKTASLWSTYYKVKLEKARESGVLALLIVVNDVAKDLVDNKHRVESPSMKLDIGKTEMPIIYISKDMANFILKKQTVDKLKNEISKSGKPVAKKTLQNIVITIKNSSKKISSENVLGYIEGGDLKDELIIVTAHYDHLGIDGKVVFNGADDDGSGTVAVINLAETFAKAKKGGHGPRRSMLFMTVAGEEKGLLGSAYYAEHPVFPLKNTVCDLNIDMIGRIDEKHANNPNYIYLIGADKLSSQLNSISEVANKTYSNLELDYTYNDEKDKNRFYYRSDHYNFAKNGIPVIFYFNGVHVDYHKETDEVEKINFEKMEKIARLVFFTAWELANRNERIVVDSNKK